MATTWTGKAKVYVVSYDSYSLFPIIGSDDTIYIDDAVNAIYWWNGSVYEELGQYPQVATYADLPPAADNNGKIYVVTTSTGIWPFNHPAGLYISNGVTWTEIPATANAITYADLSAVAPLSYDDAGTFSTSISSDVLVGRYSASTGVMQEISLDSSTLSLSDAGVLSVIAASPSGSAGGDLSGTYPNPTVAKINGATLGTTTATSGNILIGSGSAWVTKAVSGDITIDSTGLTAIGANKVTLAQMAQMATASFLGRNTASTGNVEVLSTATAKTMLNLSGTNSGDVTLAGENYLSISGQVITANAVNLAGTNVTGILPNSKTTATSSNTASDIVARDGSGNFSASTITMKGFLVSDAASVQPRIRTTLTGSINTADLILQRGDDPNGYNRIIYQDGSGIQRWAVGMTPGDQNYRITDSQSPVDVLTITAGTGITSTATFAGKVIAPALTISKSSGAVGDDLILKDPAGGTNSKTWNIYTDGAALYFYTITDAGGTGSLAMQISRNLNDTTIKSISFPNGNVNISALTASKLASTDSAKNLVSADLSGDVSTSGLTTTIGAGKVVNSMIANATIDLTTKVTGTLPNANTTATSANTALTIVARDSSNNFSVSGINMDSTSGILTITGSTGNSSIVQSDTTGSLFYRLKCAFSNSIARHIYATGSTDNWIIGLTSGADRHFRLQDNVNNVTVLDIAPGVTPAVSITGTLNVSSTITGNLSGTATNATNIDIADDNTTIATMYPVWVTANTGNLPAKVSSTKLTFNPNSATLTTTTFSGALSGNATTATTLQVAKNIGGVSFNGSADIVPSLIQTIDETSDTTCFPLIANNSGTQTSGQQPKTNSNLTFDSNSGTLGVTALNINGSASYPCRAWVNFNGVTNSNINATYTRTGTTVTVTSNNHGYLVGHWVYANFTSGGALSGAYIITSVATNTFTFNTVASGSISTNNVTLVRNTINGSGNVHSVTDAGTGAP